MSKNDLNQTDTPGKKVLTIKKKDLPQSCPPKSASNWDLHPKVFLDFHGQSSAKCPYCGCEYELVD
ncbi:MAG: zinc-finger domain-containing protein [Betaproteobacteria bacterium]